MGFVYPNNMQWQKRQFVLLVFGTDGLKLIMVTMGYYMIAIIISNILLKGLNLYFSAILAGLTGAAWGIVVQKDIYLVNKRLRKKWFSQEEYESFVSSIGTKSFWFIVIVVIELILVWHFRIY